MTDYLENEHLEEQDLHPQYRAQEEQYRTQAAQLWERNEEARKAIRADVAATPEARQNQYMQRYREQIEPAFEKLANDFGRHVSEKRAADRKRVEEGTGAKFSDYLIELSSKPVEELPGLMQTAQRTGQKDLARAIAQTALDKDRYGLFKEWAETEPELAQALQRLRGTPSLDQLRTRTLAMRPPRARAEDLAPTYEDRERAQRVADAAEASRKAFFRQPPGPVRRVGRRVS